MILKILKRQSKTTLFVLFITFISITACKSDKKKVIEFNDKIIIEQEAVINAESELINALNDRKLIAIDSLYKKLLSQIVNSENNVNGIIDPDPQIGFKQAALKLFSAYKTHTQNGYKTLVDLSYIPDSIYTSKNEKQFEEISSSVYIILNSEVTTFISVQNKLADKYKFSFKK